jgi:proteasome lid subunit RPN8/RPN11
VTNEDLIAIGKDLSAATREYVRKCTDALGARIKALEERPVRDGKDGAPGQPGEPGTSGADGKDGRDGLPGVPGQPGEKGMDGKDGRDGINGKDGADGLGFDDIEVEHDGERGFSFKFIRGERVKEFGRFTVPVMINRGVFVESREYAKDDVVTWAGGMWLAKADRPSGKPNSSPDWLLVVKKGSDGRSAPAGGKW